MPGDVNKDLPCAKIGGILLSVSLNWHTVTGSILS